MHFHIVAILLGAVFTLGLAAPGFPTNSLPSEAASVDSPSGNMLDTDLDPSKDPCAGNYGEMYQEYGQDLCPPRNTKGSDGHCQGWSTPFQYDDGQWGCGSFCQNTTVITWAQEVPFGPVCHSGFACHVLANSTAEFFWDRGMSAETEHIFNAGISGGLGPRWGTYRSRPNDGSIGKSVDSHLCTYNTFVPQQKTTRGVFTTAVYSNGKCTSPLTALATARQSLQDVEDPSQPRGTEMMVRYNCTTLAVDPHGMDNEPVYQAPGVAVSTEAKLRYLKSRAQIDCRYMQFNENQPSGGYVNTTIFQVSGYGIEVPSDEEVKLRQRLERCGGPVECCGWTSEWYDDGDGPGRAPVGRPDPQYWWRAFFSLEAVSTDFACVEKALAWLGLPHGTTCFDITLAQGPPVIPDEPEFPDEGIKVVSTSTV